MSEKLTNTHRYDDIIHEKRPESGAHPKMPAGDRAAQFSPFAALTGYDEAIRRAKLEHERRMLKES